MDENFLSLLNFIEDVKKFFAELFTYAIANLHLSFLHFEKGKGVIVTALYKQRGKLARRFVHTGMAALAAVGMMIAPVVAQEFPGRSVNPWDLPNSTAVLSAQTDATSTIISDKARDKSIPYTVQSGDTVSTIAQKFGVSEDTIRWENNLASKNSIKEGQVLSVLPVTGVSYKVQKGDTVYTIAKKFNANAQAIVDFPYNTFVNDETFELAIGQTVIVPDGTKPDEVLWSPLANVRQITPNAGTVVASGIFIWPTSGVITQRFSWYHPAIDIANNSAPDILAADAGVVTVPPFMAGGYGNYVMINHDNGYVTLYGHMQAIYVTTGQTVERGDRIGKMGSTGRSTGTHCHFEVRLNGVAVDPLSVLK
jgi:murein DD-endopeptidase MepM/ murein hydrolase activator NlpD